MPSSSHQQNTHCNISYNTNTHYTTLIHAVRFLPCQIKSQVWKKGFHRPTSTPFLPSNTPSAFCFISPFLVFSLSFSLHQYLPLSIISTKFPLMFLFSCCIDCFMRRGEEGRKGKRERWRYLLINLSWSWPPINQTDKKHWMAEQRRQAEREGRRSTEVHSHERAETHTGGHIHAHEGVCKQTCWWNESEDSHPTVYTGLIVCVNKIHIGVHT